MDHPRLAGNGGRGVTPLGAGRTLRRWAAALPLAAALLAPAAVPAAPLDTVVERGVLRIAVYRDFPPFSDEVEGRLVGVDVELGRRIAEGLGVKPDIFLLSADETLSDDLRNAVWKGPRLGGAVADLMLHVPYDREFQKLEELSVLFGAYYQEELVVARRQAPATLAHLAGERIGVETDAIADLYLGFAFGGALRQGLVHFMTYREMAAALFAGDLDAVMGPRSQVEAALGERRDRFAIVAPATPGLMKRSWPLGMAVKQDSRDLAYAVGDIVQGLMADGSLERLFQDHGLTYTPPEGM